MNIKNSFNNYFTAQAKRVLTQLDRDPDSPTYGCFDRNYWHYKIRDFPSSILQQGVFVLDRLKWEENELLNPVVAEEWTLAAINALSRQVGPRGQVSEYFPFEDSYPASAFGLYCAARILSDWKKENVAALERVQWNGLQRLARRLSKRRECEAANQYAAGLAGLALASQLPEMAIDRSWIEDHADRVFSLQHSEGWFNEYGGPDFGYLTVTIDALTDYYDATNDTRAVIAITKAVEFLAQLVGSDGQLPWTLNARNTDYVVPYGLVRTAAKSPCASWLVCSLFGHLADTKHAIWSTDDRYHLHYIFSSIVRSIPYLKDMVEPEAPIHTEYTWLEGCGYWIRRPPDTMSTIYVGVYKGGVTRVHQQHSEIAICDNAWRMSLGKSLWTTNWWQLTNKVNVEVNTIKISGQLVRVKLVQSRPILHFGLRAMALVFGHGLTSVLKKIMIFRKATSKSPTFMREIQLDLASKQLVIEDAFSSPFEGVLRCSPRQNMRHVASADSFHVEENQGVLKQSSHRVKQRTNIRTFLHF